MVKSTATLVLSVLLVLVIHRESRLAKPCTKRFFLNSQILCCSPICSRSAGPWYLPTGIMSSGDSRENPTLPSDNAPSCATLRQQSRRLMCPSGVPSSGLTSNLLECPRTQLRHRFGLSMPKPYGYRAPRISSRSLWIQRVGCPECAYGALETCRMLRGSWHRSLHSLEGGESKRAALPARKLELDRL
jgi:hypothetical protein